MEEKGIYEMIENDCYNSSLAKQSGNTATSTMGMATVSMTGHSSSLKCFRVIVMVAILLNSVLIIGVGAALAYYQTQFTEINQKINQGLTSELSNASTSGPPGPQGTYMHL